MLNTIVSRHFRHIPDGRVRKSTPREYEVNPWTTRHLLHNDRHQRIPNPVTPWLACWASPPMTIRASNSHIGTLRAYDRKCSTMLAICMFHSIDINEERPRTFQHRAPHLDRIARSGETPGKVVVPPLRTVILCDPGNKCACGERWRLRSPAYAKPWWRICLIMAAGRQTYGNRRRNNLESSSFAQSYVRSLPHKLGCISPRRPPERVG